MRGSNATNIIITKPVDLINRQKNHKRTVCHTTEGHFWLQPEACCALLSTAMGGRCDLFYPTFCLHSTDPKGSRYCNYNKFLQLLENLPKEFWPNCNFCNLVTDLLQVHYHLFSMLENFLRSNLLRPFTIAHRSTSYLTIIAANYIVASGRWWHYYLRIFYVYSL